MASAGSMAVDLKEKTFSQKERRHKIPELVFVTGSGHGADTDSCMPQQEVLRFEASGPLGSHNLIGCIILSSRRPRAAQRLSGNLRRDLAPAQEVAEQLVARASWNV